MAPLSKNQNHNSPSPPCTSDLPPQTCLFSKLNHDLRATMLRIEITTIIHPLPASPMLPICKTTTIFHPRSSSQCWSNSQKAITQLVLLGLASNIPFEATVTLETIYFLTLKVKSNISFCQKQDVGIEQELFDKLLFFHTFYTLAVLGCGGQVNDIFLLSYIPRNICEYCLTIFSYLSFYLQRDFC